VLYPKVAHLGDVHRKNNMFISELEKHKSERFLYTLKEVGNFLTEVVK
jgi:hypothetical protein